MKKETKYSIERQIEFTSKKTCYEVRANTIAKILTDFIDFVCELKGHKIGVGEAHIRRFIQAKVIF